jgi:hypothetical protein
METLSLPLPLTTPALTDKQFEPQFKDPIAASAAMTVPRERCVKFFSKARRYSYRVVYKDSLEPGWLNPTIASYFNLLNLTDNWDSYGSKPINRDLIQQSLTLLTMVMHASSPHPSVVPMSGGGIQIEWHRRQQDLEIAFLADEAPQYYYKNRSTGVEQEGSTNDIGVLSQLLGELS